MKKQIFFAFLPSTLLILSSSLLLYLVMYNTLQNCEIELRSLGWKDFSF